MKKLLSVLALSAALSGCSTVIRETVIAHSPRQSSVPEWIETKGGEDKNILFQVGFAEAGNNPLTSSVEDLAEQSARMAFATAARVEVESFADKKIGIDDSSMEKIVRETVNVVQSGVRITKTYWQKIADADGDIRVRAWAYATVSKADFRSTITSAKNKAAGIVSADTIRRADEKFADKQAE